MKINKLKLWKSLLSFTIDDEDYDMSAKVRDVIKDMDDPDEEYEIDEYTEYGFKIESGDIYMIRRNKVGDKEFLEDDNNEI